MTTTQPRGLRIAMVGQRGLPATYGGIERHVEEIARRLAARGHRVDVYCRYYYTPPGTSVPGIFAHPLIHNATESVRLHSLARVPFMLDRMLNARILILHGIENCGRIDF